jgi:ATP-binding cassette subfamily C protein/ATP-binding cassette subfamily C protein LapB
VNVAQPIADPGPEPAPADLAAWDRDRLFDALLDGRLSGTPVTGPWAEAMMEVFARLDLAPAARDLAYALPRDAGKFGIDQMIETLDRLGVSVDLRRVPRRLEPVLPHAAIVVRSDGSPDFAQGPARGRFGRLWHALGRARLVLVPRVAQAAADPAADGGNGTGIAQRLRVAYAPELRLVALTTVLSYALIVTASLSVAFIFDAVLPARAMDTLVALTIGVLGLGALDLALGRVRTRILADVTGRIDRSTRRLTVSKLLTLPPDMISTRPAAEQLERLRQFDGLRDQVAGPLVALFLELPLSLVLLLAIALISPKLAGVSLVFALGLALFAALLSPRLRVSRQQAAAARASYTHLLQDAIASRTQILRRGLGPVYVRRLSEIDAEIEASRFTEERAWRLFSTVGASLTPFAIGCIVFVGALDAMNGAMTNGALVACTVLAARLFLPMQQALMAALRLPETLSLVNQIDRMLALPDEIGVKNPVHLKLPDINKPLVALENVSLRFPGGRLPLFAGLTWQVPRGAHAAITARSGAGKTSLLHLLAGRLPPSSGIIRAAGTNLAQLHHDERARFIGFAGPACVPVSGTVAENLRLLCPDASKAQLEDICLELRLDRDLAGLSDGLSTRLGHGMADRLTPSFRTRLALARLFLAPPALLLLDEPETGLSSAEEQAVLGAIRRRMPELSCVMVTQRPAFMRAADAVFELSPKGLARRTNSSPMETT